ncbi:MAG: AAA family ATPase [Ectothiorhodospiraceae bacterium]|nr:AAA family ATPase [Ectothiorhodospiraceae bacterium]
MSRLNLESRLMPETPVSRCAFCGLPSAPVVHDSGLCPECLDHCNRSLRNMRRSSLRDRLSLVPGPADLVAMLDRKVAGLGRAKRVLAVAVYNHYKRALIAEEAPGEEPPGKANLLLAGPSGVGKTFLVECLADLLQVPYAAVDAASLTAPGYAGADISDMAEALMSDCGGDLRRARHGIVFIDNLDKLRARRGAEQEDLGGVAVQQALLCMLDGGELRCDSPSYGRFDLPTRQILFIAAGTFAAPAETCAAPGFTPAGCSPRMAGDGDWLDTPDFLAELAGRFPLQLSLPAADSALLTEMLLRPGRGLLASYQARFRMDGVQLKATPAAVDAIVRRALLSGGGARALSRELERLLLNALFHVPSLPQVETVWLDAAGGEPVACLQQPLAA